MFSQMRQIKRQIGLQIGQMANVIQISGRSGFDCIRTFNTELEKIKEAVLISEDFYKQQYSQKNIY